MTSGKPRWKSKTYWFAGILAFIGAALQLDQVNDLVELLPAEYQGLVVIVISLIVAGLREVTTEPVGNRGKLP